MLNCYEIGDVIQYLCFACKQIQFCFFSKSTKKFATLFDSISKLLSFWRQLLMSVVLNGILLTLALIGLIGASRT